MGVEQNDFWHLFTSNLPLTAQTQHVLCMFATPWVTNPGLTGKERLKAFPLQAFQQGDGGDVCVTFTAGFVFFLAEYAGHYTKQLFTG